MARLSVSSLTILLSGYAILQIKQQLAKKDTVKGTPPKNPLLLKTHSST